MANVVPVRKVTEESKFVWRTRDGELIPLHQMEDSHLQNLDRWLRDDGMTPTNPLWNPYTREAWKIVVRQELERRHLPLLGRIMDSEEDETNG